MNNRPLTPISEDPVDFRPLAPNDVLLFAPEREVPPGVFDVTDSYCRKRWRIVQHLANNFWLRWRKEYLSLIQERNKWNSTSTVFNVGGGGRLGSCY